MYDFSNPLIVADFSGGFTDDYFDGPANSGQVFDNLYILKDKKIFTRPGRTFYVSAAQAQIPAGNARISALIKHRVNTELFAVSGRNAYYVSSSAWTTLQGPVSSNPALGDGSVSSFHSWSDWRGHTILCSDALCEPAKIYRNESSAFQVRTAGLPSLTLEGAIDLANNIKSKYNSHRTQAGRHATNDTTNVVSSSDATDFDSLVTLVNELTTDINAHFTDAALAASWAFHFAQESPSNVLSSTASVTSLSDITTRLDTLKTNYNSHDANGTTHHAGTANQVTAYRLPQVSAGAGTGTYLYRFYYYYEYYVDDVLHIDRGPTLQVTLSSADTGTKSISNLPNIANGTTRCYDTTNIRIYIARTVESGTTFYDVGYVSNATTTYSDTTSDTTLQTNSQLYTNGGILDNDAPPKSKYFVAVNEIGVYANLKIGTKNYPQSFITSIPGDIDSCPGSFQDEIEADITGVSSVGIYPILFARDRFYRLEGTIDEQGRGTIFKREVSRTKGTISNNSIVQIPQGLVFAGEDGFYYTDGFNPPQILSLHLIDSYHDLVSTSSNEKKIYGEYDNAQNRVLWTVKSVSGSSDNDALYVLDLNLPLSDRSVFTTQSGTSTCFRPTALAYYNRTMVQADSRGYVFKYDSTVTTDPKVDTSVAATYWEVYPIIFNYKSCALSLGTLDRHKFVPQISLEAKNDVNTTIQISVNKNDAGDFQDLKEIRSRDQITWGDPSIIWNESGNTYYWNIARLITAKRRLPAGNLRCMTLQTQITNAYTNIYRSDDYSTCTINTSTKLATFSTTLPTDIVDYYISFEDDDYVTDLQITARNSATTLTFSDPTNFISTSTARKWVIKGYKKGETIYLLSYALRFAVIGRIQTTWKAGFENA